MKITQIKYLQAAISRAYVYLHINKMTLISITYFQISKLIKTR